MARALKLAGDTVLVLSMGRGKASGENRHHTGKVRFVNGVPIVYAPFSERKLFSEFLSLISLSYIIFRLRRYSGSTSVVFWNRTSAYIPSLFMSYILGFSRFLDLEDGDLPISSSSLADIYISFKRVVYNRLCSSGAIISCNALSSSLAGRRHFCYYGVSEIVVDRREIDSRSKIVFLMCGTLSIDTGALTLYKAIRLLRELHESWVDRLEFVITGKGDCINAFEQFVNTDFAPSVKVMGRLNDLEYNDVLASAHVGLALKQVNGPLATTTFPSKVIEMASAGLLVITTDISDVKAVLGDNGAVYLTDDEPERLISAIRWIVANPGMANAISESGAAVVRDKLSLSSGGLALKNYLSVNDVH
jgi:glycosyltransferase involved in cell wall biosynthesis